MAVKKNDIALSFDKAEYYSLEEASEYLNRKHGIDNITPRKLLKHIASYNIAVFVYVKGFEISGDFDSNIPLNFDPKNYNRDDEEVIARRNLIRQLVAKTEDALTNVTLYDGVLLKLNEELVNLLPLRQEIHTSDLAENFVFNGILPISDIKSNSKTLDYLRTIFHQNEPYFINWVYAIYSNITLSIDEFNEHLENDELFKNVMPQVINYQTYKNDNGREIYITPYFKLKQSDLVLLHRDLEKLESQIISNAPIPEKELIKITDVQMLPRVRGKSPNKTLAQAMANHIAKNEWAKDIEYKIRISEMCEIVWAKLIDLEFHLIPNVMPDKATSIKEWLTDIPPHAREAGRPTNS